MSGDSVLFMQITEQEALDLKDFVTRLNTVGDDAVIAVEGIKDANALRCIGYTGNIMEFHKFRGIVNFTDAASVYKRVIVLFDWDVKGRYLTRRVTKLLQRRSSVDISYKKRLRRITRGKLIFIEQLVCYEQISA